MLVFERFTDRARRVLVLAQEEARLLNHNFIGTEHLLLGLLAEGEGVGAKALESLGVSVDRVRELIEQTVGSAETASTGAPPFTPRSKKVLELSLREALQLGHNSIGTEHMLLGLVREGEGVACTVLTRLGVPLPEVRAQVLELLGMDPGVREPYVPPEAPLCPHCRASLRGATAYRVIEATVEGGAETHPVMVVHCTECGRALGVLGASTGV